MGFNLHETRNPQDYLFRNLEMSPSNVKQLKSLFSLRKIVSSITLGGVKFSTVDYVSEVKLLTYSAAEHEKVRDDILGLFFNNSTYHRQQVTLKKNGFLGVK